METKISIWVKIKKIKTDISKMKKLSELVNYIPMQKVQSLANILLLIWILTPVLIMFCTAIRNVILGQINIDYSNIEWFTILQQTGYLGMYLGVLVFTKSILILRARKVTLQYYFLTNLFPLFLALLLSWSIMSCFKSDNIILSFNGDKYRYDGLKAYFAYSGILSCGYIINNRAYIHKIIKYNVLVATILSLLTLMNIKSINDLLGLTENMAVFNNSNHFAYYLCIALMCSALLLLSVKKKFFMFIFRITEFSLITAALIQNKSFGPYLAVFIGLLCCFSLVFWLDKTAMRRIGIILLIFILISAVMNTYDGYLANDIKKLSNDAFNIINNTEKAGSAGSGRWLLWVKAIEYTIERPLFGFGPDNLETRYAEDGINIDRPHNEFLQIAASLGIPALIFYLAALVTLFAEFIRKRKQVNLTMIGLACTVIAYLISSMFGNTMYYTTPFFMMILGMTAGQLKTIPEPSKQAERTDMLLQSNN